MMGMCVQKNSALTGQGFLGRTADLRSVFLWKRDKHRAAQRTSSGGERRCRVRRIETGRGCCSQLRRARAWLRVSARTTSVCSRHCRHCSTRFMGETEAA
ncbi:unnamed protein product [Gulo gulo]|uniref:Uncharacterized protein n=1 Tax=Gulo gulo TaxID=48420 RepID=A0A9X9PXN2_GULGU|nr:unnamed protein product [Gulo gulo]